jgi:hypothetical protein
MHRIAALALLAVGASAATITSINPRDYDIQYITLSTGESLVSEYSTANYIRLFGEAPTHASLGAKGTPMPEDGLVRVQFESLDGLLNYDAGVFEPTFWHYFYHAGGVVLWEGDGFYIHTPQFEIPDILASGGVRIRMTNLGAPITFGDPIHSVFPETRVGAVWSIPNEGMVGAGPAIGAWLEVPDTVETPEPGTWGMMAGAAALLLWSRTRTAR